MVRCTPRPVVAAAAGELWRARCGALHPPACGRRCYGRAVEGALWMSCTPRAMVTAAVRRAVEGALWMSCTPRTMVTVAVRGGRAAPPGLWSPLLCGEPLCAVGARWTYWISPRAPELVAKRRVAECNGTVIPREKGNPGRRTWRVGRRGGGSVEDGRLLARWGSPREGGGGWAMRMPQMMSTSGR